ESAEVRPLFKARLVRTVPSSGRNWIAVNAGQQAVLNRKFKKNDNSTLEKIHGPVAFAPCPPSHPARVCLLCAFADSAGGQSGTGWRLSRWQYGGRAKRPV